MSDFDKEAERQRLREKYEEEEAEREVTQQMSELLLRGATMTNKHCEQCQNPVFRYEGEEFCPVCQGAVEGEGAAQAETQAQPETQAEPQSETQATESGATAEFDDGAAETAGTPSVGASEPSGTEPEPTQRPESEPAQRPESEPTQRTKRQPRAESAAGDLSAARESLVRTLTDLADRAERTSDVRRQRDLLAGAREAAEAIEALDRAR
ncbi:MAG: Sjogren's syndrome/scleroderma autoantigen 1 family protein [Halobacteriaceae archaeon]